MSRFEHSEATQVGDPQAASISAAHHEVQTTQKTALLDKSTKGAGKAEPTHLDMTDPFAKKDGGHTDPLKSKLQSGDGSPAYKSGTVDGKPGGDTSPPKGKDANGDIVADPPRKDTPVKPGLNDTPAKPGPSDTTEHPNGKDLTDTGVNSPNEKAPGNGSKAAPGDGGSKTVTPDKPSDEKFNHPNSQHDGTSKDPTGAAINGSPEDTGVNKPHIGDVGSGRNPSGARVDDRGISPGSSQKAGDANATQQVDVPMRREK